MCGMQTLTLTYANGDHVVKSAKKKKTDTF